MHTMMMYNENQCLGNAELYENAENMALDIVNMFPDYPQWGVIFKVKLYECSIGMPYDLKIHENKAFIEQAVINAMPKIPEEIHLVFYIENGELDSNYFFSAQERDELIDKCFEKKFDFSAYDLTLVREWGRP